MARRAVVKWTAAFPALLLLPPLSALAQPDGRLARVAIVTQGEPREAIAPGDHPMWGSFFAELQRLGHQEGVTVAIDRWAVESRSEEHLRALAQRIVETKPDVIYLRGTVLLDMLMAATTTIPIVANGTWLPQDVASYRRPGGNVTGIDGTAGFEIFSKQVQLLYEAVPTIRRVAWLGPENNWEDAPTTAAALSASAQLGLELEPAYVDLAASEESIRRAFELIAQHGFDALIVGVAVIMTRHTELIAGLALATSLPAIGFQRRYAEAGLLMAYSAEQASLYRRGAALVDQILDGADPSRMPIERPTRFDFVVNLRTASALGLTLPPATMLFATEIIE
jgi:putative ABC transport system substrate-binding protein